MLTPDEFRELIATDTETRRDLDRERDQRTRKCNVSAGMVQCSGCGVWFYDGGWCDQCNG